MWELINTEERDGFELRFYAMPEEMHPNDCFDDDGGNGARYRRWRVCMVHRQGHCQQGGD